PYWDLRSFPSRRSSDLYQAWAFVAPGLYQQEKRLFAPLFVTSIALFYAGIAFAFFVVFPLIFGFLVAVAPEGVAIMTDINEYLEDRKSTRLNSSHVKIS